MKKIYENDPWYTFVRFIADRYIRGSFKKIRYEGLERIPKDGAVIFSPNHCDALMDPLAVLAMNPAKKVFVARADIFKKPMIRKILTFFKIMPINRVRDGFRSVLDSEKTIENSIEVLNNRVPFCILPEGMHRPKHSLLPLGKGLSRIAYGAVKGMEDGQHVYIVPIGCEYGDYFRYRSTLLATVGEPIDVTALMEAHPEMSEPEMLVEIKNRTAEGMKQHIVYIPDDEDYDAKWELARLASGSIPECRLQQRLDANREAVGKLGKLREEAPEKAAKFFEKALAFAQERKRARISLHAIHTRRPFLSALWYTLRALVFLPFAMVLGTASLPGWVTAEVLASRPKDRTFRNSFRCATMIILWSVLAAIAAIILFCTVNWYWALLAVVLLFPAPLLTYDYFELVRRTASAWRYLFNGKLRRQKEQIMLDLRQLEI
ncbi:MAG: 1-acyl-sn-glycerol-3-phosphate acyltransferase [Bacteroidales bacterium]|nr:1-acyl-sn-glycerol-3-phosphate acyltransferase [Bacteroidales bacterium]